MLLPGNVRGRMAGRDVLILSGPGNLADRNPVGLRVL